MYYIFHTNITAENLYLYIYLRLLKIEKLLTELNFVKFRIIFSYESIFGDLRFKSDVEGEDEAQNGG